MEYVLRRKLLLNKIGAAGIAIIPAAKVRFRSDDEPYPYRQNSDFYYLTGFNEQDAVAVFVPGRKEGEFLLFNLEHDPVGELWTGMRSGQEGACKDFGADQAFSIATLDSMMPNLIRGRKRVYFNIGSNFDFDARVMRWVGKLKEDVRSGVEAPREFIDLCGIVHEMRLHKSAHELTLMRKACEITAKAQLRAMQKCRPGMIEYELEAEALYEFHRLGARHEAFKTIVGCGTNACTLHYTKNEEVLVDGELVLLDAGAEYEYYAGDVTRTFPVNGKFSPEQKAVYEAVLSVQLAVIAEIKPGIRWNYLQQLAEKKITEQLIALGLLQGSLEELLAQQAFKPYFMHRIGHWLGIDTHDAGEYSVENNWRVLEPGMVFTVEPGIYDSKRSIGVRIEDDILVTENGCEVLTALVPKTVSEIEALMKK